MPEDFSKQRDTELILPPGVFVFSLDETKGKINTLTGPYKQSLSSTDKLVIHDQKTKRFVPVPQSQAIQTNVTASKGQYLILENPAKDGRQPDVGKLEDVSLASLKMGQTENIPGPLSIALWPGQNATLVDGHHLRSNQYLLVRVYDDEAAKANWDKTVVRTATVSEPVKTSEGKTEGKGDGKTEETKPQQPHQETTKTRLKINKEDLRTGQLLVIRGTEIAFYIPPTGIEVLKDEGKYVRDAVTLERLEYAILLDEDGNKEYVRGPEVVFPKPTQEFVTTGKDKRRKYRAFEMQPTTGLHLKVIADYEENGKKYKTGEELFITGTEMPIYYPRPEHSIIKYNGGDKHFATSIPAGEGRYVMDRQKGGVTLIKGPVMFLPDPRTQVMVRRILTEKECALYYPGNAEALEVNRALQADAKKPQTKSGQPIVPTSGNIAAGPDLAGISYSTTSNMLGGALESADWVDEAAGSPTFGDAIQRSSQYKPPRTITLDSKYMGGVRIEVYPGYAVQVVNSEGNRKVIVGPQAFLLAYDEKLAPLTLSTGRPKSSETRKDTAYLKHMSNPVSDLLQLRTQDMVDVDVQVKYLVRFEQEEKDKWFNIDNYIQHMCDHLRSVIHNAVRRMLVQDFYQNSADILREIVLGAKGENGQRPLKHFEENGMTVYDMQVTTFKVNDPKIADLLVTARKEALGDNIALERQVQKLEVTRGTEQAKRQTLQEIANTEVLKDRLDSETQKRQFTFQANKTTFEHDNREARAKIEDIDLAQAGKEIAQNEAVAEALLKRQISQLVAEASATKEKLEAVQPLLVDAIMSAAHSGLLEKVVPTMGALAFVNGQELETTLNTMLKGTPAEGILQNMKNVTAKRALLRAGAGGGMDSFNRDNRE